MRIPRGAHPLRKFKIEKAYLLPETKLRFCLGARRATSLALGTEALMLVFLGVVRGLKFAARALRSKMKRR